MSGIEHIDIGPYEVDGSQRPPLLFLHGLGGNAESWRPQLDAFAARQRCVAWTMPGYGRSAPLAGASASISGFADAAVELLDRLEIELAVVIGHSLGGFVAQELALAHPERVGQLVLVATTATFGRPGSRFNDEFLAARLQPLDDGRTPADLAPELVDGLVGPAASAEVRAAAIASMAAIPAASYRAALEALVRHDAAERLATVAIPTVAIAADHDRTAPVRSMERLVELIPSARLEIVHDCGHLINSEQPEQFNRLLGGLLTE